MLLLDKIETAILEARSANAELEKVHPDNVLIHFDGWEFDEAEALMKQSPITTWPEFSIVLRAHQTMRGLTTLTPNAKQRFVQTRVALERDEPVNNLAVLELYLQLHDSDRAEQAEELLDRFEQSCKAAVATAAALAAEEEAAEEEQEVVSPIALQVAEGAPEVEEEEDGSALSPLGGGNLFSGVDFDDEDLEDGEDDYPVVSPIAAAMGVEVDDLDAVYEEGYSAADQFDATDDDDEPAIGLGAGLLGGDADSDGGGPVSSFGLSPIPGEDDHEGEDDDLPELDLESFSDRGGRAPTP